MSGNILLEIGIIYCGFTCFVLNVFGMVLSYDQQFYEWKIVNIKGAQFSLFMETLMHFGVLVGLIGWKKWQSKQSRDAFQPLLDSETHQ